MAQEVRQVVPELVTDVRHPRILARGEVTLPESELTRGGGIGERKKPGRDFDPTTDGVIEGPTTVAFEAETLQGVNYVQLIPILTQAIKEQQDLIEEMSTELAILRTEMKLLKECTKCSGTGTTPDMRGSNTGGSPESSQLNVFPNPTSGQVTVNHPTLAQYGMRVVSGDGKVMLSQQVLNHTTRIDTTGWPAGTYTVETWSEDGGSATQTLVVQ
jgi:hypothetical protein